MIASDCSGRPLTAQARVASCLVNPRAGYETELHVDVPTTAPLQVRGALLGRPPLLTHPFASQGRAAGDAVLGRPLCRIPLLSFVCL